MDMPTPDTLDLTAEVRADRAAVERDYLSLSFAADRPERLAISLTAPKAWRVAVTAPVMPTPSEPSTVLASLVSPDGAAALTVTAFHLAREVAPSDFLSLALDARGFETRDAREFETSYGRVSDVVATRRDGEERQWVRAMAIKDGDLAYLLEGAARLQADADTDLDALEDTFLLAAQSLALVSPTKSRFAEPYGWRVVGGQARTLLPTRWADMKLAGTGPAPGLFAGSPDGARIALVPTEQTDELLGIAERMAATLPLGVSRPDFTATPGPVLSAEGWTVSALGAVQGGVPIRALLASRGGVSAVLVSPGPGARVGVWPHATRVLEVAVQSLGPLPE